MLDTHEPGNDGAAGPVSTTNTLEPGRQYFAIVSGTYSLWGSSRWTSGGFLVCGTPEPTPMFVSPGTANGAVGADPETLFALVKRPPDCPSDLPRHIDLLQEDTGDGNGFTHHEPFNAGSTPNADHTYVIPITGQDQAASFRLRDTTTSDNYGQIQIDVVGPYGGPSSPL